MRKIFLQTKSGYTIIETMIAISVFLVVVTMGMGALLNANLIHRKSQDTRDVIDNLSFIMDEMSRNLRVGYNYRCFAPGDSFPPSPASNISIPKSCANGWLIAFESGYVNTPYLAPNNNDNDQWVYYIGPDSTIPGSMAVWKATAAPYDSTSFIKLTPPEVIIDASASSFSVLGAEPPPGDLQQPLVGIRLVGKIVYKVGTPDAIATPFSLQTFVSQRVVDIGNL